MPIGIIETAAVIAAVSGTYSYAKNRQRRKRRRNLFKTQRENVLDGLQVSDIATLTNVAATEDVADALPVVAGFSEQDSLEKIWGIGPVYVERLNGAGIHTCADLAASSPLKVLEIVAPTEGSPRPDVESWIEQASASVQA